MTVKELIKQLKTLDQDSEIKVYMRSEYGSGWQRYDLYTVVQENEYDSDEKVYVIYHE